MRPDAMTTPADDAPVPEPPPADAARPAAPSLGRRLRRRRPEPPAGATEDAPADDATAAIPAPPAPDRPGTLRRRRRALIGERQDAVYHLGGLAFELYRRDLITEEVMRQKAGEVAALDDSVRDIDTRLWELDRRRRERRARDGDDPAAGCCLGCRAPFRPEARFCANCGLRLAPPSQGDEQPTAAIAPLT